MSAFNASGFDRRRPDRHHVGYSPSILSDVEQHRLPKIGEIQIVTLLGRTSFIGWLPARDVQHIMDAFEQQNGLSVDDRSCQIAHARIRIAIASALRGPDVETLFPKVLASGCLWLALRHWSNAAEMSEGLLRQVEVDGCAVVTASIADRPPIGTHPDTAWAFMIGSKAFDGRARLAEIAPNSVEVTQG